jgi:hypothetical protein
MVAEHTFKQSDWMLGTGRATRVYFLQGQNIRIRTADERQDAIEIMQAIGA